MEKRTFYEQEGKKGYGERVPTAVSFLDREPNKERDLIKYELVGIALSLLFPASFYRSINLFSPSTRSPEAHATCSKKAMELLGKTAWSHPATSLPKATQPYAMPKQKARGEPGSFYMQASVT